MKTDVQFITDAHGNRTAVLIPVQEYEAYLEYLEDVHLARAAREALADEERIPWEQVKAELIADGRLQPEVFTVNLTRQARKDLAGLDTVVTKPVTAAITGLASNPRPQGCLKIVSEEGVWRIRIGDYQVAYAIDDAAKTVAVARVGHRSDFYD